MKITEVIEHRLAYPVERPYRNSRDRVTARPARLVEVRTDAGITGWGEGGVPDDATVKAHAIGRDPFDVSAIYDALSDQGRNGRTACGVEMALWDVIGKALDKPVWALLGGRRRERIPAYASGFFQREGVDHFEDLASEARRCRDLGFRAMKARIGFGPDYDPRILAAIRDGAGSDVTLAADVNLGYDVDTAIEAGKRLADVDLAWYEEPVPAGDLDGYCRIREALPFRIAGAEGRVGVRAFREVIDRGAMDILQPDISVAGGFTECKRIEALAWAHETTLLPHYFGTAVRLAATLHWIATIPEEADADVPLILELDVMENALRTDLAKEPFDFEDGEMRIPDGPGLGIEVDEAIVRKYTVR